MGMNATPAAERVHIGFFGRRNAGKSSVVNAVTGQDLAVVSQVRGTTTDPVYKTMELLPMGPVMIIDTPGYDDEGSLGELRVRKTRQVLNKTDVAVLVVDAVAGFGDAERELLAAFEKKQIPFVIAYNKCDLRNAWPQADKNEIYISALKNIRIRELKEKIAALSAAEASGKRLVGDLVKPDDLVVLVTPIDSAAPKGRLILPQQQVIRDLLESGAVSVVIRETELETALRSLAKKPALVITDSQAFQSVSAQTPKDIALTSFSILMARYKGTLKESVRGASCISRLKDEDIGTVKLPRWLRQFTGKTLHTAFTSGTEFPEDLSPYKLVLHCGGCMVTEREMRYRIASAVDAGVPVTNYGTAIAYMNGILERALEILPDYARMLQ